jgi:hypothetical protein
MQFQRHGCGNHVVWSRREVVPQGPEGFVCPVRRFAAAGSWAWGLGRRNAAFMRCESVLA